MCDPVTALSAAAMVGGQAIAGSEKAQATSNAINARNAATKAEIDRQGVYQGQTGAEFDKSLALFDPVTYGANLDAAKTGATARFNANSPLDFGTISTARAPAAVKGAEAGTVADVFSRNADRNAAAGNLQGYTNHNANNAFGIADAGRNINVISGNAKVSSGVGAAEADAAWNNAAKQSSGIGEILSSIGGIGLAGGANKLNSLFNPMKIAPAAAPTFVPGVGFTGKY